jgi:hypothetical protein
MGSWFSAHHVDHNARQLFGLILLVALLYCAAGVGMAYVAGWDAVQDRLASAQWWWLAPSFGGVLISFGGYYFAYRGIAEAEGGPEIERGALLAVVTAGFGGLLAYGATALDDFAMRAGGADKREAKCASPRWPDSNTACWP